MNSTTHQLSNVQNPKSCITTRYDPDPVKPLLLKCDDGYGHKYLNNPELLQNQRFYPIPALDENG